METAPKTVENPYLPKYVPLYVFEWDGRILESFEVFRYDRLEDAITNSNSFSLTYYEDDTTELRVYYFRKTQVFPKVKKVAWECVPRRGW